jgi:hypothetical protein
MVRRTVSKVRIPRLRRRNCPAPRCDMCRRCMRCASMPPAMLRPWYGVAQAQSNRHMPAIPLRMKFPKYRNGVTTISPGASQRPASARDRITRRCIGWGGSPCSHVWPVRSRKRDCSEEPSFGRGIRLGRTCADAARAHGGRRATGVSARDMAGRGPEAPGKSSRRPGANRSGPSPASPSAASRMPESLHRHAGASPDCVHKCAARVAIRSRMPADKPLRRADLLV